MIAVFEHDGIIGSDDAHGLKCLAAALDRLRAPHARRPRRRILEDADEFEASAEVIGFPPPLALKLRQTMMQVAMQLRQMPINGTLVGLAVDP